MIVSKLVPVVHHHFEYAVLSGGHGLGDADIKTLLPPRKPRLCDHLQEVRETRKGEE